MRYSEISRKEQKCQDLTSLTVKEFDSLVPVFEEEFRKYMKTHCLDRKDRIGREYVTYMNCPLPTAADRLLFILTYVKTNNLQVVHGELFGMSQGKANQWIHTLLPVLQAALQKVGDVPARSMKELARRLGKDVLPALSSSESLDDMTSIDTIPDTPENSRVAQDILQNMRISASGVSSESSDCSIDLTEEKHDPPTSPPFFAKMGQREKYSGQRMMKSKKSITVERKRHTL
jgi:hypothetical protein